MDAAVHPYNGFAVLAGNVGADRCVRPPPPDDKRSMRYDPRLHRRRSIRLKDYDYSLPGDYFLTICTDRKRYLFGSVVEGRMHLNAAGTMVAEVLQNIPKRHGEVELDVFVLMPNHLHGIIRILAPAVPADRSVRPSLTEIVRRFKPITTGMYRKNASSKRLAAVRAPLVAAKLLRTSDPRSRRAEQHPLVHR